MSTETNLVWRDAKNTSMADVEDGFYLTYKWTGYWSSYQPGTLPGKHEPFSKGHETREAAKLACERHHQETLGN